MPSPVSGSTLNFGVKTVYSNSTFNSLAILLAISAAYPELNPSEVSFPSKASKLILPVS